jgi:hypothetical protein
MVETKFYISSVLTVLAEGIFMLLAPTRENINTLLGDALELATGLIAAS